MTTPRSVPDTRDATSGQYPLLLVDDDSESLSASSRMLRGAGYSVATESAGDRVLRLVRTTGTRLVISELYVACSEGRCVVAVLMADRMRLPRVSVLVHTRYATSTDVNWALAAGADAIVRKGARPGSLVIEVMRLLEAAA
jgi:CheY-like chemotaxis protein